MEFFYVRYTSKKPERLADVTSNFVTNYYFFASAAVPVDSSHMTASSSASWSRFSPPSNFVNGHMSTMWLMVCRWPQSQEGDWARPHLCKLARRGPWPVRKRFTRDHIWRGRSKPGCRIVGSVTIVRLTTEADDQSSLHCIIVSTDVMLLWKRPTNEELSVGLHNIFRLVIWKMENFIPVFRTRRRVCLGLDNKTATL